MVGLSEVRDARASKALPHRERAMSLLEHLIDRTPLFGNPVRLAARPVVALAWAEATAESELVALLRYLAQEGMLDPGVSLDECVVTVAGHEALAAWRAESAGDDVFVGMWFDDRMDDAYNEGLKPAIEDCGYRPWRVDKIHHNERIDDQIIAAIRRSPFVVIDFTFDKDGHRGGVYHEAGFAQGAGVTVIRTVRRRSLDALPLNTRQYQHIVWTDAADLRKQLADQITALMRRDPGT